MILDLQGAEEAPCAAEERGSTDSDSGVVVGEGRGEPGVGRSISGVMARQSQEISEGHKRVYLNHRAVRRVRDLKYRRITRTKARSMEELREKLRDRPVYAREEGGFSHA